ncbi:MAG: M43 family zinc metalloprotease [Bacteroidota bacterium]
MKKITLLLVSLLSFSIGYSQKTKTKVSDEKAANVSPTGTVRCASTEYEQYLQDNDSKRMTDEQFESWIMPLIENYKNSPAYRSEAGGIITIPVVVHVIHNGEPVGTAPNITDAQVESQITVLNNDFRRLTGTPGFNTSIVGADTQIQFALAKVDPSGNPTNGIDRVNLCTPDWNAGSNGATIALVNSSVKPVTIWNASQYMNMWSVNFGSLPLLGYAQFPSNSTLADLAANGGSSTTDGVVSNYGTFGSRLIVPGGLFTDNSYDKGRTMTHEVGHFLGLRHIWGDAACGNDYCADTPTAHTANYGCPTVAACTTGNEMVQNYMDYTDDSCMNIYTLDQKARMTVVMNNATRRLSLKTSTKDQPIPLFANDGEIKLETVCTAIGSSTCPSGSGPTIKVTIFNRGTSNLTSAVISYNIDGGASNTYNWSGNLTIHQFATFDMPIVNAVNGVFSASLTTANGVADQRATNNDVTTYYEIPPPPTSYGFTNVVYRLQGDRWGLETTWNLKNSAGTTLYSGGPYTNLPVGAMPALITQNWTLPTNTCYTFTINDTYGDGICCDFGAGYYDIKSTDGLTTVASGASYGTTESKAFNIAVLGNDQFGGLNDVYLFPNPAHGSISIAYTTAGELPSSYTIHNTLGQVVAVKTVSASSDLTYNTTNLSNGVYFVTIEKNNERKTLRFIKE